MSARSETGAGRRVIVARDLGEHWLAFIDGGAVTELRLRPERAGRWLGAIVKGRVTRLAPGVHAAFVDGGLGRDLFVVRPDETPGIDRPLRPGDEILVQIIREADGGKGFRATPVVTLAGWSVVIVPGSPHLGVSHRISDAAERARLRQILETIAPPGTGLIARTAAVGARGEDLEAEVAELVAEWAVVEERARESRPPTIVHREQEPALSFLKDHLADGIDEIVVAPEDAPWVTAAVNTIAGESVPRVREHTGPLPAVEAYRLDAALEQSIVPAVPLPGGGRIVIQATEALVAIDVNSGRDVSAADLEETALRTNLEAAREVARQLRLRDLAGLIVVDFIDMTLGEHREQVDRAIAENLASDRSKKRILPLSEFCVAQITRQRRRTPIERFACRPCPHCGSGLTWRPEAEARRLLRQARVKLRPFPAGRCELTAPEPVLDAARRILDEWGPSSGVPPADWFDWRIGPAGIKVLA